MEAPGRDVAGPAVARPWLWPAAAVASCVVFAAALGHTFAWDDRIHLLDNPHLNPPSWAGVRALWAAPFEDLYSPVVYTVWAALSALAGGGDRALPAWPFHALCLVLHAVNTLLVFLIARRIVREPRAAAAGAALFALHPLQVEPVVWVSGLKDVLCGTFALGALLALARDEEGTPPRWSVFAAATALYLLALFTKPAAVALPVVALALERLALGRPWRRALTTSGIWVALALPMAWVTSRAQPITAQGFESPWLGRPVLALDAIGFYLGKLVWPTGLSIDHGRMPLTVLASPGTFLTVAFALAVLGLCAWGARRQPLVGAAAVMFVGPLLPVLGFVPFVFQYISTVADRYAYLALLGPALGLAAWLHQRRPGRNAQVAVGAALLALAAVSVLQTRVWADPISLFGHAIARNPDSYIGHQNLSYELLQAGQLPRAVEHARRAVAISPHPSAWFHLGSLLSDQGQPDEAELYLRKTLEGEPGHARAHFMLGLLAERRHDRARAIEHLRTAVQLEPALGTMAAEPLGRLGVAAP